MLRVRITTLVAAALLVGGLAGCGGASNDTTEQAEQALKLTATTPPPSGEAGAISWALSNPTASLDPIYSFGYPENSIVDSLCEALLRRKPDLTIEPGLAESVSYTDPKTLVIKLRPGVHFWDGKEVTAEDVVFSLERAANLKLGSFYAPRFDRVSSIEKTGPFEVAIRLKQPDYWLRGELSAMPGVVIEKDFAEREGKNYGTPNGGVMCTGPFKLKSWQAGGNVVIERNDQYQGSQSRPQVSQITFVPMENDSTFASALESGDIDGGYRPVLTTYDQLKRSGAVTITSGPSLSTDALVVSNLDGPLGDARVRKALSLALEREGYLQLIYNGQAELPRTSTNPGTWAYAPKVFEETSGKQPQMTQDIEKAKKLVEEAGAQGEKIVMVTVPALPSLNAAGTLVAQAGEAIGLEVKLKSMSPNTFGSLFIDPKAREGIDIFPTLNGPDFADPGPYLASYAMPSGGADYSGWEDPTVTKLLSKARETGNDDARAKLESEADELMTKELPWIPVGNPATVLVMSKKITGAPASEAYIAGPWANMIGAAGK